MNIIISGGTGFIGTNLCLFLLKKEEIKNIVLIDNFKTSNKDNLKTIKINDSK